MREGEEASKWLKKVTNDQNINDLDEVATPVLNGFRRWFVSRILGPTINMGYYDTSTGKVVLGQGTQPVSLGSVDNNLQLQAEALIGLEYDQDTTSDNTETFTVPANKQWYVIALGTKNNNRAVSSVATFTPNGGSAVEICDTGTGTTAQYEDSWLLGGTGADNATYPIASPIWASAGDAFAITQTNFVVADTVQYKILYYEFNV